MTPAVAERRQLRLAAARVQCDRNLADVELRLRCPDHHLGGELHPGRAQVESWQHVAADRAQPAMGVADRCAVENVEKAGEDRISDPAQPGHRSGLDVLHPVAHDELGAVVELLHEARDLLEVVGQIRVDHDDVVAACSIEACLVRLAVSTPGLVDDFCAGRAGDLAAAVLGAVVDDDDLTCEPAIGQNGLRAAHTFLDVLCLIEAGNDHRNTERRGRGLESLPLRCDSCAHDSSVRRSRCMATSSSVMKICMVYDCLYPHTIGGAERWYRQLALHLSRAGHDVTYVTMPQWDETEPPDAPGCSGGGGWTALELVLERSAASCAASSLRFRRVAAPGESRLGVRGRAPRLVPLLSAARRSAASAHQALSDRRRLVRGMDARVLGRVSRCLRPRRLLGPAALCPRTAGCVLLLGVARAATTRSGGSRPRDRAARPIRRRAARAGTASRRPGRRLCRPSHSREAGNRDRACVRCVHVRRSRTWAARSTVTAPSTTRYCARSSRTGSRTLPRLRASWRRSRWSRLYGGLCALSCLRGEKAMASSSWRRLQRGTPVVVVRGPDNAAVELVEEGVNGFVAASASPEDLGEAIVRVHRAGAALRHSTAAWFARNAQTLSTRKLAGDRVGRVRSLTTLL